MRNSNDTIGNRTRDLPAYSAMTQPTAPPSTPTYKKQVYFWRDSLCLARAYSFPRFLNHTQRRTTVGRTPLDEWSARLRDLYLTTHNTHNRKTSMLPGGGIRTHNLSKGAAADLRLRPRGPWDRLYEAWTPDIVPVQQKQSTSARCTVQQDLNVPKSAYVLREEHCRSSAHKETKTFWRLLLFFRD